MATALQQQLAAISAKSTDQLNLKAQKQRHAKSLLFEPREAASQSFDTLFQICGEGFDDLCALDGRYRGFAPNLFAPSSVEVERETLNKKENDDLNKIVDQFLGLICGRLLLRPALKCVEWLIRRWKALEHNVESLLLAFLPYHGHDVFPTLMSILPAQLPPTFGFLRPYVAALQSPPRHAVVAAAVSNAVFTTQLGGFVLSSAKRRHHSSALIGFWASVTAQAVNGMLDAAQSGRPAIRTQKIEDVLLRVLPVLQDALSVKDVAELYMASCMIMTILATKAHLDDRVLDAMMEAVSGAWMNETLEDGLLCLSVLAEEKNLLEQPAAVAKSIMGNEQVVATLHRLGEKHRTGKLILGIILAVTKSKQQIEDPTLLWKLSENAALDHHHYEVLSRELLVGLNDSSSTQLSKNKQRALLQHLSATPEISQYVQLAAKQAGKDIKQLGLNLVEPPQSEAMVVDEPSPVESDEKPAVDFAQIIRDLPKLSSNSEPVSFVTPALANDKVQAFVDAFQSTVQDQAAFDQLLQVPALHQQEAGARPEFITALAATWTTSKSAATRSRVLTVATETVSKNKTLDFQELVPYILAALSDVNQTVRQSAARLVLAVCGNFTSGAKTVWCKDSIYGKQSANLHHLTSADAGKLFLDIISPVLEDCVLDPTFLARHIADQLNESDIKSATRSSICSSIASHAIVTGNSEVKLSLLTLVARLGKVASQARKESIVPYAKDQIKKAVDGSVEQALARCLSHRTTDEIDTLQEIAQHGKYGFAGMAFKRLRELFSNIKPQSQFSVADFLVEQGVVPDNDNSDDENSRSAAAQEAIREAPLNGDVLAHLLDTLPTPATLQDQERPSKRRRTSKSNTEEPKNVDRAQLDIALRKLTLTLELVEGATNSKHAEPMPQILKGLFHLLSEVHRWRLLADSDLVYVQSLLLGDLLSTVNGLEVSSAKLDRSVLRTDLIVEALRSTNSPQVHNTALLLISRLATLAPETVLHSVMPLFTFMSTNTLRQADQYASHVVNMTVESIVPPLAASLKKGGRDLIQGASELLLSFTAAWEHMPLHRRLATFKHLVQTLGEGEALYAVVAMLVERYRQDNTLPAFVKELCNACKVDTQLLAVRQYLNLLQEACKPRRPVADAILGFGDKNPEQVKESIVVLFDGLPTILANPGLRKRIATEMQKSDEAAEEVRKVYGDILERIVSFSSIRPGKGGVDVQDPRIAAANERALEALLGLMPTEEFIEASAGLMQTGSEAVRTRVFTSLTERVGSAKQSNMALRAVFIDALPNCTAFLVASQPISVRRAAIECVDGIAEKYGKLDRAACADAAEVVAGDAALGTAEGGLRITSLLCLSSMVESLAEDMLGLTPVVLNKALGFLEGSDAKEVGEMRDAVFAFLNALLDTLPFTLSATYLDRAIITAAQSVQKDGERVWAVQQFSTLAAKKIAFPELTTSLSRVWETVAQTGAEAVLFCVEMLQQGIKTQTKAMVTRHAATLFPTMLKAFDLRRVLSEDEGNDAFSLVGETAMDMTLKLNDTTFRPFFLRLVSWAAEELPKSDNVGRTLRGVALYDFAHRLFGQLGGLVTSYSGVVLENVVAVLEAADSASQEGRELLAHALRAMQSSFSHDQDDFWSAPQHFDAIRTPLVNLLASSTALSANSIIPAITSFADAVSASQDNLKTLNTSIMALLKHEGDSVRLAAVQCERAVTQHLAFDWLNLLPEMLPVISELLEDDNEEVERECLAWVREIEGVTGESLEGMLS